MWFVYMIGTLLACIALYLALKKKPTPSRFPLWQPPRFDDDPRNTSFDERRDRYRDGGVVAFKGRNSDLDEPWKRAEANVRAHPPRETGKHPGLAAPYGRKPIILTPRQLERVNTQRRLAGRQPLNKAGFTNAIAHAWDQPRRQPDNTNDWLTYFILYQVFLADHAQHRLAVDSCITISPDLPYNGHGGEFAGAGASGSWDAPAATGAGLAAGLGAGSAFAGSDPGPATPDLTLRDGGASTFSDSGSGQVIDERTPDAPAQPASAPGLSPGSSAPDPTPPSYSPSADSGYSAPADAGGGFGGGDGS